MPSSRSTRAVLGEELGQPPDRRDDLDRAGGRAGTLAPPGLRDLLGPRSAVVSLGSIGAERRGGACGAAKAALAAWSAGLSAELGPSGVTVNVVSPGYIAGTDFFQGAMTGARHELLVGETHDKRPGSPEDVAELVFFLASPGARHITGQTIHINGGAFTTR